MPTITKSMLARAHAEMERRLCIAENAGDVDAEVEDVVVVASGVTRYDLHRIPRAWCRDVRLDIRGDGALVVTCTESRQHRKACGKVYWSVENYASENNHLLLNGDSEFGFDLSDGGGYRIPDVCVRRRQVAGETEESGPLVLIEIEVRHRSLRKMVETTVSYFDHLPTVQRVVWFKFYPNRAVASREGLLCVPAMALVFARANGTPRHGSRVRIIAAQSFGNAAVDARVVNGLATARLSGGYTLPMVRHAAARQIFHRDRVHERRIRMPHVEQDLAEMQLMPFVVPMDAPYPDIPFELFDIFTYAMYGWVDDQKEMERRRSGTQA